MTQKQKNDILIIAAILLGALCLFKGILVPSFSKTGAFFSNLNVVVEDRTHKAYMEQETNQIHKVYIEPIIKKR